MRDLTLVNIRQGAYRGAEHDGVNVWHGVPYAGPIQRFEAPSPLPNSNTEHDASSYGAICPQWPSRLAIVMGPMPDCGKQDEESSAVLSIYAPSGASRQSLPVMVFAHGGAFVAGGSQTLLYDGSPLAKEGDALVVIFNYRLGVFGFLPGDDKLIPCGTQDVIAAFEWVRDNVAAFGGDPTNVTGFGQSAGAYHIQSILDLRPDLIRRAILQSNPGPIGHSLEISRKIREFIEKEALSNVLLHDATTAQLLDAQAMTMKAFPGILPPFMPTIATSTHRQSGDKKDILLGWTKDEGTCFAALRGSHNADTATMITNTIFRAPSLKLCEAWREKGHDVTVYELDWAPDGFKYGATHCIDLPLLFSNYKGYKDAPLLGDTPWIEWNRRGKRLRETWAAFARNGTKPTSWDGVKIFDS